jgi:hypothetical protein
MAEPMTREDFEKEYPMEAMKYIPAIFYSAISLYRYGDYLKGYNAGIAEMEAVVLQLSKNSK